MPWDDKDLYGDEKPWRYVAHIESSKAGFTDYNNGETCLLILEGKRQTEDKDLEDWTLWIAAKGFKPGDEAGDSFIHESGNEKLRFNPQSKIHRFIRSANEAGCKLSERGVNSLDATMYAGLSLVIEEQKEHGNFGGREQTWRQPVVLAYLGDEGPKFIDVDFEQYDKEDETGGEF